MTGTAIAPMALAASTDSGNSGRLVIRTATRSPGFTPCPASPAATARTRSCSRAQVIDSRSYRIATESGLAKACRAT